MKASTSSEDKICFKGLTLDKQQVEAIVLSRKEGNGRKAIHQDLKISLDRVKAVLRQNKWLEKFPYKSQNGKMFVRKPGGGIKRSSRTNRPIQSKHVTRTPGRGRKHSSSRRLHRSPSRSVRPFHVRVDNQTVNSLSEMDPLEHQLLEARVSAENAEKQLEMCARSNASLEYQLKGQELDILEGIVASIKELKADNLAQSLRIADLERALQVQNEANEPTEEEEIISY